jgi:hypothetical protein
MKAARFAPGRYFLGQVRPEKRLNAKIYRAFPFGARASAHPFACHSG